jgi:ferredoxin
VKRKIIHIDAGLCNGCGNCIPNCPEGALQMIDGKARLVSDLFCDGLGACIGECPVGAITVEEREAEPYSERRVMENIVLAGENTVRAHLRHLEAHGETGFLEEARSFLRERGIRVEEEAAAAPAPDYRADAAACGCPGSRPRELREASIPQGREPAIAASELAHWPVQLHLIPPGGPAFRQADVLLSADCVAYAFGDFHRRFLAGRSLAIACPKLDAGQDVYLDKLTALIDFADIRSLTVLTMEVPCCRGLLQLALQAAGAAKRKIPVKWVEIGVRGEILRQQELAA